MPSSSSTSGAEPESDLLMLFFATLLIAIVVASCLRTPADDRAPAGAHQQHAGGRKKATAPVPSRPMTARAKALQKELGLSYGSPVTVTTRGVVLAREGGGFVPQALDTLRLLLEFADVFLLIEVAEAPAGDADKTQALATLKAEGVVRATTGEQQGVAKHKILFHSTAVGKQAIVRQLRPHLHVDFDTTVVTNLVPHIPHLLLVDPAFPDPLSAAFRVVGALGNVLALLPPPLPRNTSSTRVGGEGGGAGTHG